MKLMLDFDFPSPDHKMDYTQAIMLTGSCFTEHIGNSLAAHKFNINQNPNGIIFDPNSVASSLASYIENKQYTRAELFFQHDMWHSWLHHSRFSSPHAEQVLESINRSQKEAHDFLKRADWLIITLGTAYSYRLIESGMGVANCHKVPANLFRKHMMTIEEINTELDNCLYKLFKFNRNLKVIFTVSPIRHIKDGLIENNRSKARLIEVVQHLVNKFNQLYYFPAYELVIDVLRDYRFFAQDLVHPNTQASDFVFESFTEKFVAPEAKLIMPEIRSITKAVKHRALHPTSEPHQSFLRSEMKRAIALQERYPFLNLREEISYLIEHQKV